MSRRQTAGLTCGGPTSRYFQVLPLQQVDLTALCGHMSGYIPTAPTEEKEELVFLRCIHGSLRSLAGDRVSNRSQVCGPDHKTDPLAFVGQTNNYEIPTGDGRAASNHHHNPVNSNKTLETGLHYPSLLNLTKNKLTPCQFVYPL